MARQYSPRTDDRSGRNCLPWANKNMTTQKDTDPNVEIVRDFLRKHPDFLEQNPDILEAINVSHNSGKAISLVERQVAVMRDRNKEMSRRLEQMLSSANENALLLEKTNRLVINLLGAKNLKELVETLYNSLDQDFSTEFYSLTIITDHVIAPKSEANVISTQQAKDTIGAILLANKAVCGVISDKETELLFENSTIGSVVALPFCSQSTQAVIALGNSDPTYYSRDIGTVFIDYIGDLLTELLHRHINTNA